MAPTGGRAVDRNLSASAAFETLRCPKDLAIAQCKPSETRLIIKKKAAACEYIVNLALERSINVAPSEAKVRIGNAVEFNFARRDPVRWRNA